MGTFHGRFSASFVHTFSSPDPARCLCVLNRFDRSTTHRTPNTFCSSCRRQPSFYMNSDPQPNMHSLRLGGDPNGTEFAYILEL